VIGEVLAQPKINATTATQVVQETHAFFTNLFVSSASSSRHDSGDYLANSSTSASSVRSEKSPSLSDDSPFDGDSEKPGPIDVGFHSYICRSSSIHIGLLAHLGALQIFVHKLHKNTQNMPTHKLLHKMTRLAHYGVLQIFMDKLTKNMFIHKLLHEIPFLESCIFLWIN
jgi:hypothetical protein